MDADMTQQAVAEKLGRPQSFVAKIESGERRLDIVEFAAFCRAVGRAPQDVFNALSNSLGE
jgi:transcriptional regulator with XRE-family HTH domain